MKEELLHGICEMTTGEPYVTVHMSQEELEMYLEFREIVDRLHDDRPERRRAWVSAADEMMKGARQRPHRERSGETA
jgi:hypothetical protein